MPRKQSLSPEARRVRAQVATAVQNGRDAEAERARQQFKALKAEDYIKQLVDSAPPLPADVRDRLALLLRGAAA